MLLKQCKGLLLRQWVITPAQCTKQNAGDPEQPMSLLKFHAAAKHRSEFINEN
jgi:hypothetical protein